ncbi:MAG TPA: hypothetical protein VN414_01540 [Methanosarcina sp.]|nr:hypothetical protein [Methanosarcina sp.]
MREQKFNKIKKTVFILLAVFLVISLTAASASAWYSKTSDGKCKEVAKEKAVKEVTKEKPVKEVIKEKAVKKVAKEKAVKKIAKEKVVDQKAVTQEKSGNKLLDFVENNWFGSGQGSNLDEGWGSNLDDGWFGDDWGDCWDC